MSATVQGKEVYSPEHHHNTVKLVPRYSGRLDGAYLKGAASLDELWVDSGRPIAATLVAQHPYVEWSQRACLTHFWHSEPYVFAALRKVRIRIGVRAKWSREPIAGLLVVVDLQSIPRPPPPPPIAWEWCEQLESYAHRVLVRSLIVRQSHCVNCIPSDLCSFLSFLSMYLWMLAVQSSEVRTTGSCVLHPLVEICLVISACIGACKLPRLGFASAPSQFFSKCRAS
jgi:hypothetical protein